MSVKGLGAFSSLTPFPSRPAVHRGTSRDLQALRNGGATLAEGAGTRMAVWSRAPLLTCCGWGHEWEMNFHCVRPLRFCSCLFWQLLYPNTVSPTPKPTP